MCLCVFVPMSVLVCVHVCVCVCVCVCACVCVCVLVQKVSSGVLNTIKTSISGTLCNPGSVFRGLDKNWCLAILSPYRTVWQNFTKDPRIQGLYHPCLLRRYESAYISANAGTLVTRGTISGMLSADTGNSRASTQRG